MSLTNIWNTFLDTTPRQWGRNFAGLFRMPEINLRPLLGNRWILASVGLHAAVFVAVVAPGGLAETLGKADASYEIEFRPVVQSAQDEVEAAFDENSEIVMRVPPKPKKKPETLAEKLLKKYKKIYVGGIAATDKQQEELNKNPQWRQAKPSYRASTQIGKVDLSKHLDSMASSEKDQIPGLSKDMLNQHLAQYQGKFQSCYESALLKDESLNGKVRFELKTGASGGIAASKVGFEGVGLPSTRTELQSCLQTVIRQIQFPRNLAAAYNRTLQFQAVLSL